ncbi:hypothetical protein A9G09_09065 [Gilliamella sp. wkB292]|uniref:penicillin-binding protein activator LpoB n=1 Tax=Gilliamella sp. wkB292 TaxID=3120262 RepID=UPI00080E8BD8|nr:hypothetical protein [Gilliamella apicola]OCG12908.1 hypothetical protein A9G09_09065 [Gilliamella apicola]
MKQIKHVVIIGTLSFILAGCQLFNQTKPIEVKPPVEDTQVNNTDVIETPPSIVKSTDWNIILSPFVQKILKSSSSIDGNKVLLISDIQNRSGDYLAKNQIDETLHSLMNKQNLFVIADKQSIIQAKQALGISADDKLVSRSKMIGLAKSINAGYVLFTTINKLPTDNNDANLSMELLSTQTGEILTRVTSKDFPQQQNSSSSVSSTQEETK